VTPEQKDMFDNPVARARELKIQRRFDEAERLLDSAISKAPSDLKAKASLADLHYRTGRFRQALSLAGSILRDDPDDPRALVVMGNVLRKRKKPREALEYFRLALAVAETDYLWCRVAACHLDIKEPTEALMALDKADTIQPDTRESFRLRIMTARLLDDTRMEKDAFERASRAAPGDPVEFAEFLLPLLRLHSGRRAVMASENLRQTPGQELNPHLLLFEAETLTKNRDPDAASQRLAKLLGMDPPGDVRRGAERLREKLEKSKPPDP
jgi:tetratricopeptide (TPR) repeat protein